MKDIYTLNMLPVGENSVIKEVASQGAIRRRFQDLGLISGNTVKCVGQSPSKNPKSYLVQGSVIAIRIEDAKYIILEAPNND